MFTAHLLNEIATVGLPPSIISEDNTGAIFLSKNKQVGGRTKQIDVRHHFICEKVECGDIRVQHVNTDKNPSDLLSKNVITRIHDLPASNISNGTLDCWTRDQGPSMIKKFNPPTPNNAATSADMTKWKVVT